MEKSASDSAFPFPSPQLPLHKSSILHQLVIADDDISTEANRLPSLKPLFAAGSSSFPYLTCA